MRGIGNIIGGGVLIGIGLMNGSSVFLGNPDMIDWVFDGLGSLWVAKGVFEMIQGQPEASVE